MSSQKALLETAQKVLLGNYRPAPVVLAARPGRARVRRRRQGVPRPVRRHRRDCRSGHAHPKLARRSPSRPASSSTSRTSSTTSAPSSSRPSWPRAPASTACSSATAAPRRTRRRSSSRAATTSSAERRSASSIVSTSRSFHGRTMGALTLTGQPKYHEGMRPLVGGVVHVAVRRSRRDARRGRPEDGASHRRADPGGGRHLRARRRATSAALRALCDERGALLMFDEVQTGYGRTGTLPRTRVERRACPTSVTLAKGIAGGFPLGAMLVRREARARAAARHARLDLRRQPARLRGGARRARASSTRKVSSSARENVGAYLRTKLEAIASRLPRPPPKRAASASCKGVVLATRRSRAPWSRRSSNAGCS